MQTTLPTMRVRAGLYISYDGRWKLQRKLSYTGKLRSWTVFRLVDTSWREVTTFPTLADARGFIVETMREGWF